MGAVGVLLLAMASPVSAIGFHRLHKGLDVTNVLDDFEDVGFFGHRDKIFRHGFGHHGLGFGFGHHGLGFGHHGLGFGYHGFGHTGLGCGLGFGGFGGFGHHGFGHTGLGCGLGFGFGYPGFHSARLLHRGFW